MGTAALYAVDYFIGFPILGIIYYVFDNILVQFLAIAPDGDVKNYANMLWGGVLIFYIIIGIFWLPRKLKEWEGFN